MMANVLAVGDVCGQSGLSFVEKRLPGLIRQYGAQFTVVNGENASGTGITPAQAESLLDAGADVVTMGNHTFARSAIIPYLDDCSRILRPANLAPQNPGRGWGIFDSPFGEVCVVNLLGRCGMNFGPDNPFFAMDRILAETKTRFVLVDLHAEATSEKLAMGFYLDGRVSALWGTHTHVQTSDVAVLPGGTGYLTDLGMTGPIRSVLGIRPEQSVSLFLNNPPQRYETAPGACKLEGAVFTLAAETGRCVSAEAIRIL